MYSEFGILPEACLQAKQYYSSIDYNGYFIFWFDGAFTSSRIDLWPTTKKIVGFTDYENDTFTTDYATLQEWKENRELANSMLIFLLVPIQENTEYEIPPSYCLGTIPSNCSYNSF